MPDCTAVFIAFEENENLGVRYLAAVLSREGYQSAIIDFRQDFEQILREIRARDPDLVGFSVIYNNHIDRFAELVRFLRNQKLHAHFTAGGHLASLRPAQLFKHIPELDSLLRFEAENTIVELVRALDSGADWKSIRGISYQEKGRPVHNPLRRLEPDLDSFPYPRRDKVRSYAINKRFCTMVAGRGCVYQCSFCDIRRFYTQAGGPVKRVRDPVRVAGEMAHLHEQHRVEVFLFQDDDFPVRSRINPCWVKDFCRALVNKGLKGKVLWKINLRPDEVDASSFEMMKEHGLFKVYLGIDDGTDYGLKGIHKKMNAAQSLAGIRILKSLQIQIDYGFLMFQPQSSWTSIRDNIKFLEKICGDGYMPVTFSKMMPYLETEVEAILQKESRLKGRPGFYDYDFQGRGLNQYYDFIMRSFHPWLHLDAGLVNLSNWLSSSLSLFSFFYPGHPAGPRLWKNYRETLAEANRYLLQTLREYDRIFQSRDTGTRTDQLDLGGEEIRQSHERYLEKLKDIQNQAELYALTRAFFA